MRRTHKFLSIILVVMMVISTIPITASAATYSGTCGDNATWTYDETTYTLTISGAGDMYDYKYNNRPWESYEDNIKTVVINHGITTIGAFAFYSCSKINSITIPESISVIGKEAFNNCKSLTNIVLPDNITLIDEWTFAYCESLTNITIPEGVTTIGDYAFAYCDNLTSITIGKGVISIGEYAFYSCDKLASITIGEKVESIGENAFHFCDNLQTIMVDSDNQYYSSDEYGVLFNKDKTTLIRYPIGNIRVNYEIPYGVTSIDYYAFAFCKVTNITIPDSVESIGYYAFGACKITNMIIPESVITIDDSAFYGCNYLTNITIGNGVTIIAPRVFYYCDSLTSIIIPNSVTSIGEFAFAHCDDLTSIILPNTVESIDYSAFSLCDNFTDVYFLGSEKEWDNISIGSNNRPLLNATIHYNYIIPFTGIKDDHFYKDDVMQKAYQLVEFEGDFYYIGDRHEIIKGRKAYVNADRINGLTYEDGTPIQVGYYEFDANGKMVMREGIVGNHIYKNNTQLKAYQLVEVDGDFYYISDRHEFVKNKRVYLKEDRINGLTYADGTPIQVGYYDFDENGKMVILNGIVGNSIYKNNTKLKAYQLVEIDGDFYLIGDRHEIVKNKTTYLNEARLNGLTYADGTPIAPGYYDFDEDGKMVIVNGVVGNKIYKNNTMLKAYQLVEVDGDFYYIGDRHEIIKGRKAYVKEDRINGLTYADGTPITAGYYEFDENGKMIIE